MKRPDYDCGELDVVLVLSAVAIVVGIAVAVLSCRGWRWW